MSKQTGSSRSTTTTEPPAFIQPYLQYGAQQAQNQYQQGGTPVVPFSPQSEEALALQEARARSGSPVSRAASGYTADVLGGKYLGGNPNADAMFNKAALATQNQLASQFAGSGRDIVASAPARADQLNDLSNQFYYQNYNDERQRQQGLVPYAGQVANQDYTDISQLRGVGGSIEDLARQYAGAPGQSLDDYLGRVTGGYPGGSSTQSTPQYTNLATDILPLLLLAGSDRRLKENIKRVGMTDAGLPVYTFRYKGDLRTHMGVMADEVEQKFPHAVFRNQEGFAMVNYAELG